ncbi:MAG: hypothetical protein JNK87_08335 [Bryobacterales bacterium]|nr:hypothetical protein [Bryobacterales bacterium]
MVAAIWTIILSGFAYNNVNKYLAGQLSYPWIVPIHAAFFFAWLAFLAVQTLLVRRDQAATHRRLGIFGAGLASAMVLLGVATAIVTERLKFGTPAADTRFLSVMFADMLVFGSLVAAGMIARNRPAAHKRLMLLSTVLLTDAGFGRWLSHRLAAALGNRNFWEIQTLADGAWPFVSFQLLPMYALVAVIGLYDLLTRKRLNPAYLAAVAWSIPIHLLAGWLYFQPFWLTAAARIIGR